MKTIVQLVQNLLKPYIDNRDRATQANIAPVETDATSASKAYIVGEQLILNNVLYDVTASIAQGDALVVNTNIAAADDITTQIKNHTVTTDAVPTKNSTNPVQSGGVYNSEKATREVIAPVEENATSASQGYAQGAQLILGGVLYDVTATITQGDALVVNTNIAVADDIVTQFASLNQTLTNQANAMVNVYGSKNLLKNQSVSQTINGVEFTRNPDGSITANGTATADVSYTIDTIGDWLVLGEDFIFTTGLDYDVDSANITVQYAVGSTNYWIKSGETIHIDNAPVNAPVVTWWVSSGKTVNNKTCNPMIRLASIQDSTYEPYSMTNQEITPYVQAISNPNLLDNPWFTVNQRGFTNSTSLGYCADRWKIAYNPDNSPVSLANDILTIDHTSGSTDSVYIIQQFEQDYSNLKLTASVLLSDGTVLEGTGIMPSLNSADVGVIDTNKIHVYLQHSTSGSMGYCCLGIAVKIGQSVSIEAVKLELGAVSTIAQDTAPNYATELLKCQRYFNRVKQNASISQFGIALPMSTDIIKYVYQFPVEMRTIPTVTPSDTLDFYYATNSDTAFMTNNPTTVNRQGGTTRDVGIGFIKIGAFTVGTVYAVAGKGYFDLSADL